MKILLVEDLASSDGGGAERSMGYLCESLSARHELYLVYQRGGDWNTEPMAECFVFQEKVSTETFRQIGIVRWIRSLRSLISICRTYKIEIIFSHEVNSLFTLRVLSLITGIKIRYYFKWINSKPDPGRLARWGLKGVNKASFVSSFIQEYWIRAGIERRRTEVIREGVETVAYVNKGKGLTNLIFAARIIPDKGLHVLIEALGILKTKGVDGLHLKVCGIFDPSGDHAYASYHRHLDKLVQELDLGKNISFTGFVKPLAQYISASDLAIVPSTTQEASPLVILESLSVGTTVIASHVGGVPELLSGMEELIFKPGDAGALADKIRELRNCFVETPEQRDQIQRRLKEKFDTTFSKEISLHNLEKFIIHG